MHSSWRSIQFSSVQFSHGGGGGRGETIKDRRFSGDPHPVFSAGGHYEHFWHRLCDVYSLTLSIKHSELETDVITIHVFRQRLQTGFVFAVDGLVYSKHVFNSIRLQDQLVRNHHQQQPLPRKESEVYHKADREKYTSRSENYKPTIW